MIRLTRHIIPDKIHLHWVGVFKKRSLIAANSIALLRKYESWVYESVQRLKWDPGGSILRV